MNVWLAALSLLQKKKKDHSWDQLPVIYTVVILCLGEQSQLLLKTSSHYRSSLCSVRYRWKCGVVFQWRGGGIFSDHRLHTDSNRIVSPSLHKLISDVGVGTLIKVIYKSTTLKLSHTEHYWVFDLKKKKKQTQKLDIGHPTLMWMLSSVSNSMKHFWSFAANSVECSPNHPRKLGSYLNQEINRNGTIRANRHNLSLKILKFPQ